jgi:hypothetical protein
MVNGEAIESGGGLHTAAGRPGGRRYRLAPGGVETADTVIASKRKYACLLFMDTPSASRTLVAACAACAIPGGGPDRWARR